MTSTMDLADAYANETFFVGNGVSPPQKIKQLRAELHQRIKELERDAKRYRWLRDAHPATEEIIVVYWKDITRDCRNEELDAAIDRAMSEAALTKMTEISQEYKLP